MKKIYEVDTNDNTEEVCDKLYLKVSNRNSNLRRLFLKLYSVSVVKKLEVEDDSGIMGHIVENTKYDEFAKFVKGNIWIDYLDKNVMEYRL